MNEHTLQLFREAIMAILHAAPAHSTGTHTVLDTMEQIQEFYKTSHDAILALIESFLSSDKNTSTPALLMELDKIVNSHFGLDKNIDMTDSFYDK